MTDALSAMEYPHWLIVAGAILVVLGLVGLAFRKRLAPIEPAENRPVTTGTEGSNRDRQRPPWEAAAQNRRDDKKPKPTPNLTTGNDLRDVNDDMFAAITELYEPKTTPQIEKP